MSERSLTERVHVLEQSVRGLKTLPTRVAALEGQILQLREETRREFSAVRAEMRVLRDDVLAGIAAGDVETRTYMRVLHEDVIARIAALDEGRRTRRRK